MRHNIAGLATLKGIVNLHQSLAIKLTSITQSQILGCELFNLQSRMSMETGEEQI